MSSPLGSWSTTSFLVGICLSLDISTTWHSARLWSKAHHSFYYLVLCIIASAHACDLMLRSLGEAARLTGAVDSETGHPEKKPLSLGTMRVMIASIVFAWIGGCGFVMVNMARFHFLASVRMRLAKRVLVVMTIISVLGCTANNGLYIFSYINEHNLGVTPSSQALVSNVDIMFSVWAIYDGVTNLCISIAFIMLLFKLTPPVDLSYSKLISQLLNRVIWVLAIECTGVIGANLVVLLAPAVDPLWNGVYLAESIRLRLFCMFLDMLSRILRKHVQHQLHEGGTGRHFQHELQSVTTGSHDHSYATVSDRRLTSGSTVLSTQTETTDASTVVNSLSEPPQLPPRMWNAYDVKGSGLARPR